MSTSATCPFFELLNNRIKICAGCRGPLMKDANGQLLPSPNNVCIGHKEPLSFVNPKTGLNCTKEGNCYYHLNRACIVKKHSDFSSPQIVYPSDVVLDSTQKMLLKDTLGFVI